MSDKIGRIQVGPINLGRGYRDLTLPQQAIINHGIICGGKGSGKHETARLIIEEWCSSGGLCFGFDVSRELLHLGFPARLDRSLMDRAQAAGLENYTPGSTPLSLWRGDFAKSGTTAIAGIRQMPSANENGESLNISALGLGPCLLSYLLNLKEAHASALESIFMELDSKGESRLVIPRDSEAVISISKNIEKFKDRYGELFFDFNFTAPESVESHLVESQRGAKAAINFDQLLGQPEYFETALNILSLGRTAIIPRLYTTLVLWFLTRLLGARGASGWRDRPILIVLDEAQIIFEKGDYISELRHLLALCSQNNIGVVFVSNTLSEFPKNIREQLGFVVHHQIRGRSTRDLEGIEVGSAEIPLEKLKFASTVTELRAGEAIVYVRNMSLTSSFAEWALMIPAKCRADRISEEDLLSLKVIGVGGRGIPNPYSSESILRDRIRRAALLSDAVSELSNETSECAVEGVDLKKPKIRLASSSVHISSSRGFLGVRAGVAG